MFLSKMLCIAFIFSSYIGDMHPPHCQPQPLTDVYDPISINYNAPYANYLRRYHYSEHLYYIRSDMIQPPLSKFPRKRIIYYAYLPEVVRSQPVYRRLI